MSLPSARELAHAIQRRARLPCGFIAETMTDSEGWTRFATPHCRDCDALTDMLAKYAEAVRQACAEAAGRGYVACGGGARTCHGRREAVAAVMLADLTGTSLRKETTR